MEARILEFIADVADTKNPKNEFNYGIFDFSNNCIYATDTRALLKHNYQFDKSNDGLGIFLAHPKMLKLVSSLVFGDALPNGDGNMPIENGFIHYKNSFFSLSNAENKNLPDLEALLSRVKLANYSCADVELWEILYEVHKRGIMLNERYLVPLSHYFGESYPIVSRNAYPISLSLCVGKPTEPIMITGKDGEHVVFEYLVMPIVLS